MTDREKDGILLALFWVSILLLSVGFWTLVILAIAAVCG
jgi:hypothetical protein